MGATLALGQNLNRDRPHAPLFGVTAGRHPDIDSFVSPPGVHAVGDREHFFAVVRGNAYFCAECNAVHGNSPIPHFGAGGGGEWVAVSLIDR